MNLIQLIVIIMAVGVLLYLANTYLPMDPRIRQILNAVVIIALILWLLSVFGVFSILRGIHVGPK